MTNNYIFSDVSTCTLNFSNGRKTIVKSFPKKEMVLVKFIPHRSRKSEFQEKVATGYHDAKSVTDLAKNCNYKSLKTFTRHFKKHFNQTPYQWMLDRKMEEVRHLVLNSDLSISEISEVCGFNNITHLINAYSARFGVPPFKNRMQEEEKNTL